MVHPIFFVILVVFFLGPHRLIFLAYFNYTSLLPFLEYLLFSSLRISENAFTRLLKFAPRSCISTSIDKHSSSTSSTYVQFLFIILRAGRNKEVLYALYSFLFAPLKNLAASSPSEANASSSASTSSPPV